MEQKSMVRDVEVQHDGEVHRATYFVEGETIHARIGGHVLLAPLGQVGAENTVRALLTGHLLERSRRQRNSRHWIGEISGSR